MGFRSFFRDPPLERLGLLGRGLKGDLPKTEYKNGVQKWSTNDKMFKVTIVLCLICIRVGMDGVLFWWQVPDFDVSLKHSHE